MKAAELIAKQARADVERGIGPQQLAGRIRAVANAIRAIEKGEEEAELLFRAGLIDLASAATAWAESEEA